LEDDMEWSKIENNGMKNPFHCWDFRYFTMEWNNFHSISFLPNYEARERKV